AISSVSMSFTLTLPSSTDLANALDGNGNIASPAKGTSVCFTVDMSAISPLKIVTIGASTSITYIANPGISGATSPGVTGGDIAVFKIIYNYNGSWNIMRIGG